MARVRPQKPAKGKTTEGQPEEPPSGKNRKSAPLKQRLAAIKAKRNKGKATEGQPEEPPSEKSGKTAALKKRLAAMKDKRNKKPQTEEADPAVKQSKKEKAQKAAGLIFFPVIVILGIPILIGKGIASGFKKVKDRKKNKLDEDVEGTQQQPQEAKASRRTAMQHRLSERSGSVKQGLSTRRDGIKKRLAERKAKKPDASDANDPTPPAAAAAASASASASNGGQADAADEDVVAGDTAAAQTGLTKKQRLASFLAAGPLAINHMLEKRRRGTDQATSTTTEDATPKDKKASRFAGAKDRVKALRTKVNKQARFAKLKARLRTLQERRQNKKNVKKTANNDDTAAAAQGDESNGTSVKRHSAIAGLAAACVALPAAKMKQVRDKRRKDKAAESVEGAAAAAREEHATANNPPMAEARESASPVSRPSGVRLVPSEPEMLEPAADPLSPPENGQSEVPVQQAARTEPEVLPEASSGNAGSPAAAAASASDGDKDNAVRPAAAVRFQSIRDGFGNVREGIGSGITSFTAKRRATGQKEAPVDEETQRPQAETMDSAETRVEDNPGTSERHPQPAPAQRDTAPSGGRFKSIRDGIGSGIEGLKAKTQREKDAPPQGGEAAATAASEDEKRAAAAANNDTASPGARLKALKDDIAARRAKSGENGASAPVKTEKSKQQKQQTHKDSNSGLVDRVRWFLYAA